MLLAFLICFPLKKLPVGHHRVSLVVLCASAELCIRQGLDLTSLWELLTSAVLFSTDHGLSQNSRAKHEVKLHAA